jgi:hypothetical protein
MIIQKYKRAVVVGVMLCWLALKVWMLQNSQIVDTYCNQYDLKGLTLHDCIACVKF